MEATGSQSATLNTSSMYTDGVQVNLRAYTINGNNYFMLRDIGRLFDFSVKWDSATNTIRIDTSVAYSEEIQDNINVQSSTLNASDTYRRSVTAGDTFIDLNGKSWTVTLDPISGTYNPADPVAFDLNRNNINGPVGYGDLSDGNDGGILGEPYMQAPNGHGGWKHEFRQIAESGYDKPSTPGTAGQLSPNKYWIWSDLWSEWTFNMPI